MLQNEFLCQIHHQRLVGKLCCFSFPVGVLSNLTNKMSNFTKATLKRASSVSQISKSNYTTHPKRSRRRQSMPACRHNGEAEVTIEKNSKSESEKDRLLLRVTSRGYSYSLVVRLTYRKLPRGCEPIFRYQVPTTCKGRVCK